MKYAILLGTLTAVLNSPIASADNVKMPVGEADLYFDTNSATPNAAPSDATASSDLAPIAKWAHCHPKSAIILEGHADFRGTVDYNVALSAKRAVTVRNQLIGLGVRPNQIVLAVYGESESQNKPLAKQRRVTARISTEPLEAGDLSG